MKYVYPVIFRPEAKGFSIYFPDIGMGGTQGDDIADGLEMAHDFLVGALIMLEDTGGEIPRASDVTALHLEKGAFASFVSADTADYRRRTETKVVKKTITIPSWLNVKAEEAHINFSQTLQRALKEALEIAN